MAELPLRRLVLYKHGVGYFERRGTYEGAELSLHFSREAMDDVLKSLIVLSMGEGKVRSIDYERPESWSGRRLALEPGATFRSLIEELRGQKVRLNLQDDTTVEGLLMGLDHPSEEDSMHASLVSLYRPELKQVCIYKLGTIRSVHLLGSSAEEVAWSLRSGENASDDRTATVQLGEGQHDLLVAYLAPAPSWRVSYRLMLEKLDEAEPDLLLQGWGLIDNVLNEDLNDVRLSLVAGRPVSFRYALYHPHQPDRPLLQDQIAPLPAPEPYRQSAKTGTLAAPAAYARAMSFQADAAEMAEAESYSLDQAAVPTSAEGEAQGSLFRYDVREPISVQRGRSALVPLFNLRAQCRRDLVYRGRSGEQYPMATVRFDNSSGFALERGPVTIIEQRTYGGEGVIPWTSEDAEVRVRYAMALEVKVREEYQSKQWTRRLRLGEDALIHEIEHEQITIYRTRNTANEERVVTIEHPRTEGYELYMSIEGPQPTKVHSDTVDWQITIAAHGEASLRVHERRMLERHESIRSLTLDHLRQYLAERMLDQTTVSELRNVLALYNRLELIQRRYQEIDALRTKLHEQQQQIRGNLDVLKAEGEEGELRTRYIETLRTSEDRLQQLRDEEDTLRAEEARRKEELELVLRNLQPENRA